MHQVIDWTPHYQTMPDGVDTYEGTDLVPGNAKPSHDYYAKVKATPGGLASLTIAQRLSLSYDLVHGNGNRDDVWHLLQHSSPEQQDQMIRRVTWQRLDAFFQGDLKQQFRLQFLAQDYAA